MFFSSFVLFLLTSFIIITSTTTQTIEQHLFWYCTECAFCLCVELSWAECACIFLSSAVYMFSVQLLVYGVLVYCLCIVFLVFVGGLEHFDCSSCEFSWQHSVDFAISLVIFSLLQSNTLSVCLCVRVILRSGLHFFVEKFSPEKIVILPLKKIPYNSLFCASASSVKKLPPKIVGQLCGVYL